MLQIGEEEANAKSEPLMPFNENTVE